MGITQEYTLKDHAYDNLQVGVSVFLKDNIGEVGEAGEEMGKNRFGFSGLGL